jgi:hypothetical protein
MRSLYPLVGFAAIAALLTPQAANAETGFGAHAGTAGWGVEARQGMGGYFSLRASISDLAVDIDETYDDIKYTGDAKFNPVGLFVDLHPFRNGWFLTGGALLGAPKFNLNATPATSVEIGGNTYSPDEVGTLAADASIGDNAPFVGLGWTSAHVQRRGVYVTAFAGAAFYGNAHAHLTATGGLLAEDPDFLASLADEQATFEDEISKFSTYPVIQLSLGYRF